jgi:hypothetical protein
MMAFGFAADASGFKVSEVSRFHVTEPCTPKNGNLKF